MSGTLFFLAVIASVIALFGLAMAADRRSAPAGAGRLGGVVYALSLAVFCTSWTFYGSVGRAATGGIGFLAVYLGPVLLFLFGRPVLDRVIRTAKAHHSTSIADLISARHGNSRALARLVTVIAVIGILPYISLQLKAIGVSFDILLHYPDLAGLAGRQPPPVWRDPAVHTALILTVFCILFGTRHIDATEQHRGLVTVVALESVIKLLAFLAVGGFVVWGMFNGLGDLLSRIAGTPAAGLLDVAPSLGSLDWWAVVLASAAAVICLPRQFQVLVVENTSRSHLRTAGWLFPLYLVAINLFVLPIAMAGILVLGDRQVPADTFVLTLPIAGQQPWLALAAFIGGLSAATAMVLIEVTALSTMVSNDLVMPLILRRLMAAERDPVRVIKLVRRVSIVAVLMLAYAYVRIIGESRTLVSIGLVSFVAAAQFAPALFAGLYLRRPSRQGAIWGLAAGFAVWGYTLLVPSFAESGWLGREFLATGFFGTSLLAPRALFGLHGLNEISHALFWSLAANAGCYLIGMAAGGTESTAGRAARASGPVTIPAASLQGLVERFIGEERGRRAFADYAATLATPPPPEAGPDHPFVGLAEKLLAGTVGNASARIMVAGAFGGEGIDPAHIRSMLKDASDAIESSRAILADALDHLGQGVTVVDADLRLVAWNNRFVELARLPGDLVAHGAPLEAIVRHNAYHGGYGPGEAETLIATRLAWLRKGLPFHDEREQPDGSVLEVIGKPLPNGGYVTTYTDVTRRHRAEQKLRHANDELESRVEARTSELSKEVRVRALTETALRRSRERLKGITDSLFEGVLMVTAEGVIAFANPSAKQLLGFAEERGDIEGHPLDELMRMRGKDGERAFADSPLGRSLADGSPFHDNDAEFVTAAGAAVAVAYACIPLANEEGRRSVIVSFRDITLLKAAQRDALQASRLASVGQLAAGIAHEINTPVQYIGDNLNFIRGAMVKLISVARAGQDLAATAPSSEAASRFEAEIAAAKLPFLLTEAPVAVQESLDGVAQIAKIVLSMKEFSHPGTTEKVAADINRALESTLTVSHNVWKQVATVETAFAPDLPHLLCFPSELNQVFLNLIVNAAQAIEASGKPLPGRITITTSRQDGAVEVSVTDTGTGIPPAIRNRIFDPFFTTKEVGKGTGQGLAICRDVVVVKHGGSLNVESEDGQGARFIMRIPLAD
ncbi:Hybrid sensor histidine kinase [Paramagnetospirillum caucaseum]|uniref:histidine kinase n=1 Tax=Paramagnetospirillum caucaseum TaxID=1244869 RepID=M3A8K0_9PROT|nr:PAS-domain containing protein [Paramagnetospirillum caucaseum]EME68849.1 Hybrid sensor histidine kinase [Paramagnetospirillum caucaseum]